MSLLPAPDFEPFLTHATLPSGWRVQYEAVVTSTNDLARQAARQDGPERQVFVADYQTQGRGRQGRTWVAPPRSGLLMSVLFRNTAQVPQHYTMLASVSCCEAIERLLGLEMAVKWPNDLMVGDRKVAGILAEAVSGPEGGYVVVGVGINANLEPDDLARLPPSATALNRAADRTIHRGELLVAILERMDAWLGTPQPRPTEALWHAWHGRLWGRHQVLRIQDQGELVEGIVEGAQPDGTLLVRRTDGRLHRVVFGEIIL
ncbi:MAG: biotin--[acetyl-CoA-carboxylase] ligase [Chloroflexi bacterium]|nr:biotin--[acetyl-CoA-carboxylase] ligase [Chloroflexota bacterium]